MALADRIRRLAADGHDAAAIAVALQVRYQAVAGVLSRPRRACRESVVDDASKRCRQQAGAPGPSGGTDLPTGVDAEVLRMLIRIAPTTVEGLARAVGRTRQEIPLALHRLQKRGFISQARGALRALRLPDGRPMPKMPQGEERARLIAEHEARHGVTRLPDGHAFGALKWGEQVTMKPRPGGAGEPS